MPVPVLMNIIHVTALATRMSTNIGIKALDVIFGEVFARCEITGVYLIATTLSVPSLKAKTLEPKNHRSSDLYRGLIAYFAVTFTRHNSHPAIRSYDTR